MAAVIDKTKAALGLTTDLKITGQKIGNIGYGLMGLTWRANPPSQEESFATMKEALAQGANFWNAGEIYGTQERNSLHLLNEYFTKYPEDAEKVVLSVKGGCLPGQLAPDGGPENVKRSIDECLRVLDGKKKLDIWESARVDPKTPIEITIRAAGEYVKAGKIGGIGLSECSADTIRRAAKVTTIAAVEVEFSLWSTDILHNGIAAACAELDIPVVAYSPIGRGFLTGQIKKPEDIPDDDMRKHMPRFQPGVFEKNIRLVHELEKIAAKKEGDCTPGQIGISWVRAQSQRGKGMPVIVPIPGASAVERARENSKEISLSEEEIKEIDELLKGVTIEGDRYGGHAAKLVEGDSPALKE